MDIQFNAGVDNYLAEGCGRCSLVGTPNCKVKTWQAELVALRALVLETGLVEELKWKQPCYTTHAGKNVLMVAAFKDYAFINFFKGVLLKDPAGLLVPAGENSQSALHIRFTNVEQIAALAPLIKDYIAEAIEVEESGKQVALKKTEEYPVPDELQAKFDEMPDFQTAFETLTPGRQRGYLLYFADAKQPKTREARIEKYMQKIFEGKGWSDR